MRYKVIVLGILALISSALWAVEFPAASPFRSTAMINTCDIDDNHAASVSGFRGIASQPALGEDGFVQSPAEMATTTASSPRKAGTVNPNPPDPDEEDPDRWNGQPIGDVLFPLLLMSLAYAVFLIHRSRLIPETTDN